MTNDNRPGSPAAHSNRWLEQVARWGNWDYRRDAFERMAQRLGDIAEERFAEVFAVRLK